MGRVLLAEGTRSGLLLSVFVVVVAVLAPAPAFSWVPELPLIVVALMVPVAAYAVTGFRVRRRTGRLLAAWLASALAGGISGFVAGISMLALNLIFIDAVSKQPDKVVNFEASGLHSMRDYLLFNGVVNVVVGLALSTVGASLIGGVAGLADRWLETRHKPSSRPTDE